MKASPSQIYDDVVVGTQLQKKGIKIPIEFSKEEMHDKTSLNLLPSFLRCKGGRTL